MTDAEITQLTGLLEDKLLPVIERLVDKACSGIPGTVEYYVKQEFSPFVSALIREKVREQLNKEISVIIRLKEDTGG